MLKNFFSKDKLFIRVAIGFALGIVFGLISPALSIKTKVVGDLYLNMLKMMIIPIVSCAVFCGIANIKDANMLKKIGVRTVVLFVVMFVLCSIISLFIAFAIRPGMHTAFDNEPSYTGALTTPTFSSFLLNIFPTNIIQAAAESSTLPVIIFIVAMSIAAVACRESAKNLISFFNSLSDVMFKILGYIMEFSPLGVLSLMAYCVAEYGSGIFSSLLLYIVTCWICCVVVFFLVMMLPACLYSGLSPVRFLKAAGKIALVTLSTTSSAATLPTTLRTNIDDLKAPESVSDFVLPLGCTINLCGGACSFCCLAVFVSDFYSLHLTLGTIVFLVFVATLINMAAPGIPGGGVVLGASFLSIIGLPFDLMGPISGFYRLLDMAFTTVNVEGDMAANLIIAKSIGEYDGKVLDKRA